jgi:hypothetical protein
MRAERQGTEGGASLLFISGPSQRGPRQTAGTRFMHRRTPYTPYLEIALTIAVLAFLAYVVAGGFSHTGDDVAQAITQPR